MPRGRAPGYDDQRELILARARRSCSRNRGYPATSMNEVAEACGVSQGRRCTTTTATSTQLLVEIAEGHVARLRGAGRRGRAPSALAARGAPARS